MAAAGGNHQRPVGLVPHAGDRRESGVRRDGGGVVTVTGEPVPGSGLVAGRRLGLRAGDRPVPGLGPLGSAIMTAVWAARRAGPHAAPGSSGAPGCSCRGAFSGFYVLPAGRSTNLAFAVIARSVNLADGWVSTTLAEVSCDVRVAEEGFASQRGGVS